MIMIAFFISKVFCKKNLWLSLYLDTQTHTHTCTNIYTGTCTQTFRSICRTATMPMGGVFIEVGGTCMIMGGTLTTLKMGRILAHFKRKFDTFWQNL